MREVNVGHRFLADYRSIVPKDVMAEVEELAAGLKGRRVLHVNATSFGGGVAEILYTLVPLTTDAGLEAEWRVITASPEFFHVTKSFHNGLQGQAVDFPTEAREVYEAVCRANAAQLKGRYDFIVIHDPQPLAIRDFVPASQSGVASWIWRCHIDTSTPDQALYDYLLPSINRFDAAVYTLRDYVPQGLTVPVREIAPTIDPLAPKNMQLSAEDAAYIVRQFGIDIERPLLLQVGRFDPWKDPLGVVDVYRRVKAKYPGIQLALIGSMASDDPEGWDYLEKVIAYVGHDPDVFILSNLDNVGSVEVNAFQCRADVVMQKSTREGFGLTVAEALWKGRPTIGGKVGGIPLQIEDGVTGYLVDSVEECSQRCLAVLADPLKHRQMALIGKEKVRREFLVPRLLRDELRLFSDLLAGKIGS
jgi:trehalose synthase